MEIVRILSWHMHHAADSRTLPKDTRLSIGVRNALLLAVDEMHSCPYTGHSSCGFTDNIREFLPDSGIQPSRACKFMLHAHVKAAGRARIASIKSVVKTSTIHEEMNAPRECKNQSRVTERVQCKGGDFKEEGQWVHGLNEPTASLLRGLRGPCRCINGAATGLIQGSRYPPGSRMQQHARSMSADTHWVSILQYQERWSVPQSVHFATVTQSKEAPRRGKAADRWCLSLTSS
ncbi:hypothetical protein P154DRAFT_572106 [Amniculicola lignicola CBS 123094]|uniref:Uncharacterized protein n=1 Tax=Amniculicola lignicola CBS 123094 TaxID=1392246 RepID=A0A6A5X1U4_9PLEO|nr:hypothetical protein P154DRAFT_572106 [Amniculicola lignicola CBS 123094]